MYSNRNIPEEWRNKLTYQDEVLNIFAKDKHFLAYLGKGNSNKENSIDEQSTRSRMSATTYTSFPHIHHKTASMASEGSQGPISEEVTTGKTSNRAPHLLNSKNKHEYQEKDILSILEDFRNAYPIKSSISTANVLSSQNEDEKQIQNFNRTTYGTSFGLFKDPFGLKNIAKNAVYSGIHTLRNMRRREKQEMFKTSIYTKLIPPKPRTLSREAQKKEMKKKKEEEESKYGPFLNFDYEAFNKRVEVTNPIVRQYLESINFFGPYYSYCTPCRNRNMEFYKNLEPSQCIELIKALKKAKGKNAIISAKDARRSKTQPKEEKSNDI